MSSSHEGLFLTDLFFQRLESLLGILSEKESQCRYNLMASSFAYVRNVRGKSSFEIPLTQM